MTTAAARKAERFADEARAAGWTVERASEDLDGVVTETVTAIQHQSSPNAKHARRPRAAGQDRHNYTRRSGRVGRPLDMSGLERCRSCGRPIRYVRDGAHEFGGWQHEDPVHDLDHPARPLR